jgi:hypothetical protein
LGGVVKVDRIADEARAKSGIVMGRQPATMPREGSGTVNMIAGADVYGRSENWICSS